MERQLQESLTKTIRSSVSLALAEDVGKGDLTAELISTDAVVHARVTVRQDAVVCGRPWFDAVFQQLDDAIDIDWKVEEGQQVGTDTVLCELSGPARPLLTGERTALNFLQTLSATATATRSFVEAVAHTGARILDTRKTLPGLRLAQKYAVRTGGGTNHRIGLFDAYLIKENHIVAAGGIPAAVRIARRHPGDCLVEIEVETLPQTAEALTTGADRLLLDNFSRDELRQAVALRDAQAPGISLEASGNIDHDSIAAVAETGVDCISLGTLTKDIDAIDLSMRFQA